MKVLLFRKCRFTSDTETQHGTYVRLGEVIRSVNPYFGTEEKQCSGHICRVLCPNKTYDEALVIRDDGTVWKIWLSNFQNWNLIAVQIDI